MRDQTNDRGSGQWQIAEGTDVLGADGGKLGSVVAVEPTYVVVEKGFFFPTDYYIPTSAIANHDGSTVYLTVSKDEALHQGWDTQPTDEMLSTTTGGYTADTGTTDTAARAGGTTGEVTR